MSEKTRIVATLGEKRLLLPKLLNEAFSANDRAKYRLTLLQAARSRADSPDSPFSDLRTERLACGIVDAAYDDIVAGSVRRGDSYLVPRLSELCSGLRADLEGMLSPFETGRKPDSHQFRERLKELALTPWQEDDDFITGLTIARLASGDRERGDTIHLLIMDMHKGLNRLQAEIATETIEGALAYGLRADDR